MKIYDLLKEFEFDNIKDLFLKYYGNYDGKDYIKEFEKIYNFYQDKCEKDCKLDVAQGELDIKLEHDDDVFYELIVLYKGTESKITDFSWFITPCFNLSKHLLENYSKEEILAHYLYQIGYDDLSNID